MCCTGKGSLDNYCLGKYTKGMPSSSPSGGLRDPVAFYCASTYCAEESLGFLMKRVLLSIVSQVDRRIEAHGLTSAQWMPLMRLKTDGASTVAELARWSNVDAGAMTRLLDRLERKGHCKRVRSTADRRVVEVELTPAGEAALAWVPEVLADVQNAHLAGFTEAEWLALRNFLERMLRTGEALRDVATESASSARVKEQGPEERGPEEQGLKEERKSP